MEPYNPLNRRQIIEGTIYFLLFLLCIPTANWLIQNVGTFCVPNGGPCLIPVFPGLDAPSGVLLVGVALVLRDLVHRRLGLTGAFTAIAFGAVLSLYNSPPSLVLASTFAFLLAELVDLGVYHPLRKNYFIWAIVLSSLAGIVVDSIMFLQIAFGSQKYLLGQIVGKSWMILLAIPIMLWLRKRDERLGLETR